MTDLQDFYVSLSVPSVFCEGMFDHRDTQQLLKPLSTKRLEIGSAEHEPPLSVLGDVLAGLGSKYSLPLWAETMLLIYFQ